MCKWGFVRWMGGNATSILCWMVENVNHIACKLCYEWMGGLSNIVNKYGDSYLCKFARECQVRMMMHLLSQTGWGGPFPYVVYGVCHIMYKLSG